MAIGCFSQHTVLASGTAEFHIFKWNTPIKVIICFVGYVVNVFDTVLGLNPTNVLFVKPVFGEPAVL